MSLISGGVVSPGGESLLSLSLGSPALGAIAAVHAAVTDDGTAQTITSAITDPPTVRSITATAGGTAGDIKAIQVTVSGTNEDDATISEVLPAFSVNTAGTVVGAKAFKTVTSIVIPAHDGTGATTSVGTGALLGLGFRMKRNTIIDAYLADVREGTAPTVAVSASAIESNTMSLNSALDASEVIVMLATTDGA